MPTTKPAAKTVAKPRDKKPPKTAAELQRELDTLVKKSEQMPVKIQRTTSALERAKTREKNSAKKPAAPVVPKEPTQNRTNSQGKKK